MSFLATKLSNEDKDIWGATIYTKGIDEIALRIFVQRLCIILAKRDLRCNSKSITRKFIYAHCKSLLDLHERILILRRNHNVRFNH